MKHFEKQAVAAFFAKQAAIGDTNFGGSDYAMYAANPVAGAVNQATKGGWNRDAWYSWIPVVGDAGNAVSNFKDGNIGMGVLDLGLGALNFIPGLGTLAGASIKGGTKLTARAATKGLQKGTQKALTNNAGSQAGKSLTGQAGKTLTSAGEGMHNMYRRGVDGVSKIPGIGKALTTGQGRISKNFNINNPGRFLATTTGLSALGDTFFPENHLAQPQQQTAGPGFPGFGMGGMQGRQGGGGLNLSKGRMQGYEQGRIGGL